MRLNVAMAIEVEAQKIQVSGDAPTVDVNPANNAGAIIISGKELEALPDDPDELLTDLQALAGPSAGPERRSVVHRWLHRGTASTERIHPRNSH